MPNYRYMCEDTWEDEFNQVSYSKTSESLQADSSSYQEMIAFAKTLASEPEYWYRHLWTSFDGDDGTMYLRNGTVFVNRLDYWFTKKPWGLDQSKNFNNKIMIEVAFEDQSDCNKYQQQRSKT